MQKGSAALFVLIAGLATVVLISLFSFGLLKFPQSPVSEPLVVAQTLGSIKSPSVPEVNIYTNKILGFQFSYKTESLNVKEDSEENYNKRGNGDFRKNFKGYVGYEPATFLGAVSVLDNTGSFDSSPFTVWVFDNTNNISVDSWFDRYWYYPFLWGVFDYTSKGHVRMDGETTIDGQPAKFKVVAYQPGKPKFMYVSKDNRMYLFRIIGEMGENLLSGFKFNP